LQGILAAGGVLAGLSARPPEALAQGAPDPDAPPEVHTETRRALDMQRQYGWSFGAAMESLTFDGATTQPFDRTALVRMPEDLRPARLRHAPFYVPTLFQSPSALPRAVPAGDAAPIVPLMSALNPIFTPAMHLAYRRGQALASLFRYVYTQAAVVVDLPGPEAVAFAAGAADVLDPVFLFDNWPHPRGVVPAHLTLAAAAYFQPLFARHAAPAGAPPLFVLDRNRLAPYADDDAQFDNRYVARLPRAAALRGMDVSRVLYVTPTSADIVELDDLNEDFVLYASSGIDVKIVAADAFNPDPDALGSLSGAYYDTSSPYGAPRQEDERRRCYYGGSLSSHWFFWFDYPWVKPVPHMAGYPPRMPAHARPGAHYNPAARITPHCPRSMMGSPPSSMPCPRGFGDVRVVVSSRTGMILGAAASRSGSWNRATTTSTGG
jgi:hypothetical protein